MVLYAAKMAQDGDSVEEICGKLNRLMDRISTSFIVPSPETLYRNGKIGKTVMNICDALSLHPVLYLSQNKIKVRSIAMGKVDKAYKKYIHSQLRNKKKIDTRILIIVYAGCSVKQLEEIREEVEKYVHFEHVEYQKASATISSNCGIGAFGLMFMRNK